ncbi:MAG: serine/threonine protein kinase [Acidobacteria bacterium]|nr:serine/threonine protein kinase [Acidobacteriota bacterium]
MMHPDLWARIEETLGDTLELPEAERLPLLEARLRDQPDALAAARRLLDSAPQAEQLFAQSPVDEWRLRSGVRLGPWELERPLGSGGMGAVWLARRIDGQADMRAAIKILPPALAGPLEADSELRRRFLAEKHILAQLDHPNIARLLDAGAGTGETPNFVMEYVDGRPLLAAEANRLDRAERLRLFAKVCHAVEYAHSKLVAHRDLKPQNILIQTNGEPKLLDFGIARLLNDAPSDGVMTVTRAYSVDYASPEQLRGEAIGTATDIYSLGIVLYEWMTGERARQWSRFTLQEAGEAAASFELPAHASLDADLLAVIRKAGQAEQSLRYRSASELAADVERLITGEPVLARSPHAVERAFRFVRRHWMTTGIAAAVFVVIAASALWARRERALADQRARDLLNVFQSMLVNTRRDILKLPGGTKAGFELIRQGLFDIERLQPGDELRPQFLFVRATAHEMLRELAGGSNSNLGDRKASEDHARASVAVWKELHQLQPTNFAARVRLVRAEFALVQRELPANEDADWAKWEQRFTELVKVAPNDQAAISALAGFHFWALRRAGAMHKRRHLEQSIELNERLLQLAPSDRGIWRNLALSHKYLANGVTLPEEEARRHASEALRLDRMRSEAEPKNADARIDVGFSIAALADVERRYERYEAAARLFREAFLLRQSLLQSDPENALLARSLSYPAAAWVTAAALSGDASSVREALEAFEKQKPEDIGPAHLGRARMALAAGRRAEACKEWSAALAGQFHESQRRRIQRLREETCAGVSR